MEALGLTGDHLARSAPINLPVAQPIRPIVGHRYGPKDRDIRKASNPVMAVIAKANSQLRFRMVHMSTMKVNSIGDASAISAVQFIGSNAASVSCLMMYIVKTENAHAETWAPTASVIGDVSQDSSTMAPLHLPTVREQIARYVERPASMAGRK